MEYEGKIFFLVQFDEGGKFYTYHQTQDEFKETMTTRVRELPHKILAVTEVTEVKMKWK